MQIVGATIEDQRVVLDFHHFRGCTFRRCKIVYHGFGPVGLVESGFEDCEWGFDGPAASTINFMTEMYRMGGGVADLIEKTFENVKRGSHPGEPLPPPSLN